MEDFETVQTIPDDFISQRHAKRQKTYIITLKFPNLCLVDQDTLAQIGYGGDLWEFRIDLLESQPTTPGMPSIQYVKKQLQILQQKSNLPILFTVRTISQGGKFPNDADQEALALIKLAIALGCEYIDVEVDWPAQLVETIREIKGTSKIVASYHEFTGKIKWASEELQSICMKAEAIGDIVKLCVRAMDINDSLELGLYVRDYERRTKKPIIAVAMGPDGQLSRFTASVTFVTHKLIPQPPGSDQLTLADINRALCLLGQLPKKRFFLSGPGHLCQRFSELLIPAFNELGFPYSFFDQDHTLEESVEKPDFGGFVSIGEDYHISKRIKRTSEQDEQLGATDTHSVRTDLGEIAPPVDITEEALEEDIIRKQACLQFEEWTGRKAPNLAKYSAVKAGHQKG